MPDVVCIKTFAGRPEAELAQDRLAEQGVHAIVSADDYGGLNPALLMGTGGARLLVHERDAREALDILERHHEGMGTATPSSHDNSSPKP